MLRAHVRLWTTREGWLTRENLDRPLVSAPVRAALFSKLCQQSAASRPRRLPMMQTLRMLVLLCFVRGGSCVAQTVLARAQSMLRICKVLQDGWDNVLAREVRLKAMSGCVRASPSSVCDGTGLFACEDLPSGTVATLYPVHALGLGSTRMELEFDDGQCCQRLDGSPYRVEIWHDSLRDWSAEQMWIDADPSRRIDGWLGHLANDPATSAATLGAGATEAQLTRYDEEAAAASNAVMVPYGEAPHPPSACRDASPRYALSHPVGSRALLCAGHGCAPLMAVVTTRAVSKGDELLLSYGHEYWVTLGASEGLPATTAGSDDAAVAAAAAAVQRARAAVQQADPAVRRLAEGQVEHAFTVQAAVELEYAAEIGRFQTVFEMAAKQAASEGIRGDVADERRAPGTPVAADAAGGGGAPINRRQRREAAKLKKKAEKKGKGFGK